MFVNFKIVYKHVREVEKNGLFFPKKIVYKKKQQLNCCFCINNRYRS